MHRSKWLIFLRVPIYNWQVLPPLELRVLISIDHLHLLEHRALTRSSCTCIRMCNNKQCVSTILFKYPSTDIYLIHYFSKSGKFHSSSLSSNMIRSRKKIFQSQNKNETARKTSVAHWSPLVHILRRDFAFKIRLNAMNSLS